MLFLVTSILIESNIIDHSQRSSILDICFMKWIKIWSLLIPDHSHINTPLITSSVWVRELLRLKIERSNNNSNILATCIIVLCQ